MPNPFADFNRNDACWCGATAPDGAPLKYKSCHGLGVRHAPGAPLPTDPDRGLYLSPDTVVPHDVLDEMLAQLRGAAIRMPSPQPEQRPQTVALAAIEMSKIPPREPTVALDVLGQQRFAILDALGLRGDAAMIERQLAAMKEADVQALLYGTADIAKATVDRLLRHGGDESAPTTLWAEAVDVPRLIGETLLFAEVYLVRDPVMAALFAGELRPDKLAPALAELVRLRPLIELGLVVPVPEELATTVTNDVTVRATEDDLRDRALVDWVLSQLVVDGPTARSVIFLSARDDLERGPGMFFIHALIDPKTVGDDGTFGMHALHPYDPEFDYGPWIAQCRRQTAAKLIQDMNRELAIAAAFGGRFVTRAPFRARLLQRRGRGIDPPAATVWVDVPLLPELQPKDLAAIVRTEDAVAALRHEMRRTFRRVDANDAAHAYETAVDLVEDLEHATDELEAQIRNDRKWSAVIGSAGLGSGSVALAATQGPWGLASQFLGAAAGVASYVGKVKERKRQAAFAFVMARRRLARRERRASRSAAKVR